jgi:hypothetical protein
LVTLIRVANVPGSNSTKPLRENIRISSQNGELFYHGIAELTEKWTWFGVSTQRVPFILIKFGDIPEEVATVTIL